MWERYQSQLEANDEGIPRRGGPGCVISSSVTNSAFAEDTVTAELVITTRIGSNGATTIMMYVKEPFDEV